MIIRNEIVILFLKISITRSPFYFIYFFIKNIICIYIVNDDDDEINKYMM